VFVGVTDENTRCRSWSKFVGCSGAKIGEA
jgi:hypothetical protein